MKNIVEAIQSETKGCSDKIALIEGTQTITYAELLDAVHKTGEELKKQSITPGMRVALLCEDSIDYIIVSLAVLKVSAVIVPVPPASSGQEMGKVCREMKINFLIFEKAAYASQESERLNVPGALEKQLFILRRPSPGDPPRNFFDMNPAFIRFSSGTTGVRKGVIISHDAILERTNAADRGLEVTSSDTILWVLSMSFHFLVTILLFLRRGATIILAANNFPEGLFGALREHEPTLIYASPFHYHLFTRLKTVSQEAFAKVRLAVSTAVRLSPDLADMFRTKFGFELSEGYGIIEVGLPFINKSQTIAKRGSVGRALPGYEIKILNPDQTGAGEICLRGKGFFSAYFSPWQTGDDILQDGWFNTGDIGYLDKDGFLFIVGRANDTINYCGMKIFPYEVEAVINQHPAVKESFVFGTTHPQYGQVPNAKIVLHDAAEKDFNCDELQRFCYQSLATYKVPKEFYCVPSLPKTLSGKLKRH